MNKKRLLVLERVCFLIESCFLVINTMKKHEIVLKIYELLKIFKECIKNNNFAEVKYISEILEGTSELDSIHVIASYIFEDDKSNSKKLLFILEALYFCISSLYLNKYVDSVDSVFWDEVDYTERMLRLEHLLKDSSDKVLLKSFQDLHHNFNKKISHF